MNIEKASLLIDELGDPSLSSLFDIAQLSYPTFLRRVGSKLSLTNCRYLYQQAIYSGTRQEARRARVRGNPQLHQITQLAGMSTPVSGDAEFSSANIQTTPGK